MGGEIHSSFTPGYMSSGVRADFELPVDATPHVCTKNQLKHPVKSETVLHDMY